MWLFRFLWMNTSYITGSYCLFSKSKKHHSEAEKKTLKLDQFVLSMKWKLTCKDVNILPVLHLVLWNSTVTMCEVSELAEPTRAAKLPFQWATSCVQVSTNTSVGFRSHSNQRISSNGSSNESSNSQTSTDTRITRKAIKTHAGPHPLEFQIQ